jgi:hypothetical protein
MPYIGDVGTEIAPETADDPELAARLDDLLHRACHLARALTGAEQAAFNVDLDGDASPPASSSTSASVTRPGTTTGPTLGASACTASSSSPDRWCG